jgi:hypothetical protein
MFTGMEKQVLPPHPITLEAAEYLRTLTPERKKLHEMAIKKLGSSYFVERTKGFNDWKTSRKG